MRFESGYNSASFTKIWVPMGRTSVELPVTTIRALLPVMVIIFPLFFVNVWKYLVSLRIVLVVPLSTRQISASAIQFPQVLLNTIIIKTGI
jgi:hypothetical protein